MKGLLKEGLVIPSKESVKDVFGHMFGYAVQDMYKVMCVCVCVYVCVFVKALFDLQWQRNMKLTVQNVHQPLERGLHSGTPSYHQSTGSVTS